MTTFIRGDQADIRVSINGTPISDSWKEAEGGSLEAADTKVRPGAMGPEVSAGGLPTRSDLTVRQNMSDLMVQYIAPLEALVGAGRVTVGITWLMPDGTPIGGTKLTRRGTLKSVVVPNMGADSNISMFEIIVSCDEDAG